MKKKWIAVLVLLPLLVFTLWQFGEGMILDSVRRIPLWLVALLAAMQFVTQALVNLFWHRVAMFAGLKISYMGMVYVNCQGSILDAITPGVKMGGEVTRALRLKEIASCTGEEAASVVAVHKLFSFCGLLFFIVMSVTLLIGQIPFMGAIGAQIGLYSFFALVFGVLLSLILMPQKALGYIERLKPARFRLARSLQGLLRSLLKLMTEIRKDNRKWGLLILLSFFMWFLYPVKLYIAAAQFMPGSNPVLVGAAAFVAYLVALIPLFPGGLGGFEGSMTGLLAAQGFSVADAAVVTVLFRFVTFWLVFFVSGFIVLGYRLKMRFGAS